MAKKTKTKRIRKGRIAILILIVFTIGILLGSQYSSFFKKENKSNVESIKFEPFKFSDDVSFTSINVPAVDKDGNSAITTLYVYVVPGSGRTLVDIDTLLFWVDTQNSIRTAKEVAANITNQDLTKYDVMYHVEANASLVGGPSAGAALTVATIAALEKTELRQDVMITGTINHDGTIGPVGGIAEKAKASKEQGATTFLVPLLQSTEITYVTEKHCQKFGFTEFCTLEQIPKKIEVGKEANITVKEVQNIEEALRYFY